MVCLDILRAVLRWLLMTCWPSGAAEIVAPLLQASERGDLRYVFIFFQLIEEQTGTCSFCHFFVQGFLELESMQSANMQENLHEVRGRAWSLSLAVC